MKNITLEPIRDRDKFLKPCPYIENTLDKAIHAAIEKIDFALEGFGEDKFPSAASKGNVYEPIPNEFGWHNGFWTGILWLAYELTGDEKYKKIATHHVDTFLTRIDEKYNVEHHDMGFLYSPSCVAAYKLLGNEKGKEAALKAADNLMSRYHEKGEFIQAWGYLDDPKAYRLIIDCLLNIPLLYWASEVTGDGKYDEVAYKHFKSTMANIIRDDASTYHTFFFDFETGEPSHGETAQGYADDSAWARGQAWGIYGTMLTRIYKDDALAIEACKKMLNFFLNRLPEDYVPYWDLVFTKGDEPRDSSAAAIAVCGIMELIKFIPDSDPDKELYENAAINIMESLYENYRANIDEKSNGLLLHAVANKNSGNGVDECNSWGDYFYMEALVRLKTKNAWKLYW